MPLAKITRMGPADILKNLGTSMVHDARSRGMTLPAFFEMLDPTEAKDRHGLSAFERVLAEAGVYTRSVPEAGVWASEFGESLMDGPDEKTKLAKRVLTAAWAREVWNRAQTGAYDVARRGTSGTRAAATALESVDYAYGSTLAPYFDIAQPRIQFLAPAIPLDELVSITTPINGDTYRATYIDDVANTAKRFVRVGERAEIPRMTVVTSSRMLTIYKFGRAIELTDEAVRRARIDRVALMIQLMAIQAAVDKVAIALDTLVSGDGNSGTAATNYNLTALDPATSANILTVAAWAAFEMKFVNPYALTTVLAQEASALKLRLLNMGSANIPYAVAAAPIGLPDLTRINQQLANGVRFGWTADAPAAKLVGFDSRVALERVIEIGSDKQEQDRFISNQTTLLTMTENEGFAVVDPRATKTLNLAA